MAEDRRQGEENAQGEAIAAISTPHGRGGIAVIRISGEGALKVADAIFRRSTGARASELEANRAEHGRILYEGEEIDDGILTVFRAPRSFTGEDSAEISCHGGILLTAKVLEAALAAGARQAEPGEFSKRAFLNGKISLTQAEAVIDLIDAENERQLKLASKNAQGALHGRIGAICASLTDLLAQVYVTIDYPDEDLSDLSPEESLAGLRRAREETARLLCSYRQGAAIARGIPTVIVGRPNTGKSSLLNQLLGRQRAIVTEYEGTTRDTLEETAALGGVTLRLCDTAGLRKTEDPVEQLGVQRSYEKIEEAELIFAVFDGSEEAKEEDLSLIEKLRKESKPVIALLNKSDRAQVFDRTLLDKFETVVFSAKEKEPPKRLISAVEALFDAGGLTSLDEGLLTNARQAAGAKKALEALDRALAALAAHELPDVAYLDVEQALTHLSGIDGREVGEGIADAIFRRFCVGK